MHLLQSGVDITVIALWLGHEDTATTHQYVEADLAMKEAALRCVEDPAPQPLRFTATDRLLDFGCGSSSSAAESVSAAARQEAIGSVTAW